MTKELKTVEEIVQILGELPVCECPVCQANGTKININPKGYEYYKKYGYPRYSRGHTFKGKKRPEHSKAMSGSGNPMFGNLREDLQEKFKGEGNPMFGEVPWNKDKPWSEEVRQKLRYPKSEEHKQKISKVRIEKGIAKKEKNPFFGHKHTEETIEIIRSANIGKRSHSYGKTPSVKCSYGVQCYYDSPLQGKIRLRSSYEYKFARYLDSKNILWYYEIETFDLSDEMSYTPDFFLPQYEKFIEIKGWMNEKSKIKISKFKDEYPWDLEILLGNDLKELGINLREELPQNG